MRRRDFIQRLTFGGAAVRLASSFGGVSVARLMAGPNPIQVTGVPATGMSGFDQVITNLMNTWSVPGMAVAVSRNGQIIAARGYGLLDLSDSTSSVNAGDTFRIASVSKPITAMTVLQQLIKQGKLSLDTLVWDLLKNDYPLLPGKSLASGVDQITIKHLLQHSAGWDGSVYDPMFDVLHIADVAGVPRPADKTAIIRYNWSQPLVNTPPGSKYAYANVHYCILGRVIEHVTGQDYADYTWGNTLEPLNAIHTFQGSSFLSGRHATEARYYPYPGEPQENSVFPPFGKVDSPYGSFDLENMDSHGAWVSSPVDLVTFAYNVFAGNTLINDVTQNRISTGSGGYYGLGWALTPTGTDLTKGFASFNVWHNGSLPGTTSILVRTRWSDGSDVVWAAVLNIRDASGGINGALDTAMWNAVETLKPFPSPIFAIPWQARHGLTPSDYQQTFNRLVSAGYRLTDVSGYGVGAQTEYAAIWEQTSGPAWQAHHGMSASDYQTTFDELAAQGYRLVLVNGYYASNAVQYAAIWEQTSGPAWQAHHGMSASDYQNTFNELVAQGYRLTWVSGYSDGTNPLYAAVWEQSAGPAWQAHHGMTAAEYQQMFNQLVGQGYRLREVSGYGIGGIDYYAAIWDQSSGPAWEAHHAMTADQYQETFNALVWGKGYQLVQVSGYQVGAQTLFAAIWEAA